MDDTGGSALTYNGKLRLWDLETASSTILAGFVEAGTLRGGPTFFSTNENFIAVMGGSSILHASKRYLQTWYETPVETRPGANYPGLHFLGDGSNLVVALSDSVSVYDLSESVKLLNLTQAENGNFFPVTSLAYDDVEEMLHVLQASSKSKSEELQSRLLFDLNGLEDLGTVDALCDMAMPNSMDIRATLESGLCGHDK